MSVCERCGGYVDENFNECTCIPIGTGESENVHEKIARENPEPQYAYSLSTGESEAKGVKLTDDELKIITETQKGFEYIKSELCQAGMFSVAFFKITQINKEINDYLLLKAIKEILADRLASQKNALKETVMKAIPDKDFLINEFKRLCVDVDLNSVAKSYQFGKYVESAIAEITKSVNEAFKEAGK
jgi:hypothetical protein